MIRVEPLRGFHKALAWVGTGCLILLFAMPVQVHGASMDPLDNKYEQGRRLMETGNLEKARSQLRTVYQDHPDTTLRGDAAYLLFELSLMTNNQQQGLKYLDYLIANQPNHPLTPVAREDRKLLRPDTGMGSNLSDTDSSGTTSGSPGRWKNEPLVPAPGRLPQPTIRYSDREIASESMEATNEQSTSPGPDKWIAPYAMNWKSGDTGTSGKDLDRLINRLKQNEQLLLERPKLVRKLNRWFRQLSDRANLKPPPKDRKKLLAWARERISKEPRRVATALDQRREEFRELGKSRELAYFYYFLGRAYEQLGRQDQALIEFIKASAADPEGELADNLQNKLQD